ncbi:MAG: ribosome assembly RNA-binding protein YhbY [Quisquiliibacterium sp.]
MNQTHETQPVAPVLTPSQRKDLRGRAHHLDPVVMIGDAGLSESVLAETNRALLAHELIKIRVLGEDREMRQALMDKLCAELRCAPVQLIGKLLVIYRPRADETPPTSARARKASEPHRPKKALSARLESGRSAAGRGKPGSGRRRP